MARAKAINRNRLKANSASCWSYYTDILRCTVNKTFNTYTLYFYLYIFKSLATFHGVLAASCTTLKMETASPSEVSITIHQPARCHGPEDLKLYQRWENFKSPTVWLLL
jgi:hypothetical protein